MDGLNLYVAVSAVAFGLITAGSTYWNKQRFEAQNALLQAGNDELRNQNKDLRDERTDLTAQIAAWKARDEEKERVITDLKRQPNYAQLTKQLSANHKEVMTALSLIGRS